MPERNFDALDDEGRRKVIEYVPGYDWLPGRFGPAPGIAKQRKEQLDRMTDKEYLYAFLKMTQEEKESLMVSEAERRRTYTAHWPIESIVKANDCAKEGFYYTGVGDRVQCAFCGGIIRNWERGDVPKFQHKNYFNYCKLVQNRPCHNIPISNQGLPKDLMTNQLTSTTRQDCKPTTLVDLNINTVKPKDPTLSVFSKRKETFRRYPAHNPVDADTLCDAGFMYEGFGDKVKCFWCDGALEMWSRGDNPWQEHAKWYPGCMYVQQTKGVEFIREARARMSADEISTAETLIYNRGDVSFLDDVGAIVPPPLTVDQLDGYQFCLSLKYSPKIIKQAYEANMDEEFEEQSLLMTIVHELDEGVEKTLVKCREAAEKRKLKRDSTSSTNSSTRPHHKPANVNELLTKPDDPTERDSNDLISAIRCKVCHKNMAGAVLLPCGCFCLCQICSRGRLPQRCPACSSIVKGACRTFLS